MSFSKPVKSWWSRSSTPNATQPLRINRRLDVESKGFVERLDGWLECNLQTVAPTSSRLHQSGPDTLATIPWPDCDTDHLLTVQNEDPENPASIDRNEGLSRHEIRRSNTHQTGFEDRQGCRVLRWPRLTDLNRPVVSSPGVERQVIGH